MGERKDHLRARLRDMYPPGSVIGDDATSAGVRDTPDRIVLMTRFGSEDRLYGIPISVQDTSHEFYYTDFPAADDEEWLDSVDIGMDVYLGTGLRVTARRRLVDDYIELDPAQGWPGDKRFYSQAPPQDKFLAELAEVQEADGFNTSPAMRALESERLVAWVQTYENNNTGTP